MGAMNSNGFGDMDDLFESLLYGDGDGLCGKLTGGEGGKTPSKGILNLIGAGIIDEDEEEDLDGDGMMGGMPGYPMPPPPGYPLPSPPGYPLPTPPSYPQPPQPGYPQPPLPGYPVPPPQPEYPQPSGPPQHSETESFPDAGQK